MLKLRSPLCITLAAIVALGGCATADNGPDDPVARAILLQSLLSHAYTPVAFVPIGRTTSRSSDEMMLTSGGGAFAVWTGQASPAQSLGGAYGLNCQYQFRGSYFWRMVQSGGCPSSVPVL